MRAVSGRAGLISEEKILKLLVQYSTDHPDGERKIFYKILCVRPRYS